MIVFWVLAPIMVICAVGMVAVRNAVHSAVLLAVVMVSLAIMYAVQDAPFLFAVQIIVYTGAVLMLFLFVLMLVGVDSADSLVETLRGQRAAAGVAGVLLAILLILGITQSTFGAVVGLSKANLAGNVPGLAQLLFSRYVFAFEVTSALLITAALGAMVLAHRERFTPKPTQRDLVLQRMREYASDGIHPGPLPTSGTFARHNSVDTPALLPDGAISQLSISRVMRARGTIRQVVPPQIVSADPRTGQSVPGEPAQIDGGEQ
ncbi:MAG: NADH-quinone oxidoreductase subunit [Nocardioidaceae bacterium]|nr:NADH-quinone oxidoreductase subunit [Nocardioidaceae bacterium]